MGYFQILTCSNNLGTCCDDPGLVGIIDIVRKVLDLFQTIIPILLLAMLVVQLLRLVINPEEKNGLKKITNRIISALIIFLMPIIVNAFITLLPSSENFQFSACWKTAKDLNEIQKSTASKYIPLDEGKRKKLISNDPLPYNNSAQGAGEGSATGQAIVNYALKFVGKPYVWGGVWNGEEPYTGTDCSGFVQGVFKHFGINLTRTTITQWADRASYTLVSPNDIRAGDLAMYSGHVAIFTGNGKEIVHASSPKNGIKTTSDYRVGGSGFLGVMRIKGVN